MSPDPPSGPAPLTVKFDMCGSTDPDGDVLNFTWDFGDGQKTAGSGPACKTQHTYAMPTVAAKAVQAVTATTCVNDGLPGHEVCHDYSVNVGCPSPKVKITQPADNTVYDFYSCGSPQTFAASASDTLGIDYLEFLAVEYFSGTTSFGKDFSAPYQITWDPGFFYGSIDLKAVAHNICGATATDTVTVTDYCGGLRGKSVTGGRRLSWTSRLGVAGGRGQVVLNGRAVSFPGAGDSLNLVLAERGENRVEAQLVEGAGQPGTWRFDLSGAQGLEAGSLRVLSGEVVEITATSVVFRLSGKPGERVAFTFRVGD